MRGFSRTFCPHFLLVQELSSHIATWQLSPKPIGGYCIYNNAERPYDTAVFVRRDVTKLIRHVAHTRYAVLLVVERTKGFLELVGSIHLPTGCTDSQYIIAIDELGETIDKCQEAWGSFRGMLLGFDFNIEVSSLHDPLAVGDWAPSSGPSGPRHDALYNFLSSHGLAIASNFACANHPDGAAFRDHEVGLPLPGSIAWMDTDDVDVARPQCRPCSPRHITAGRGGH